MRTPPVRHYWKRSRLGFGAAVCLLALNCALGAMAQELSQATKRLFDAVWVDDLARVKASISAGADLTAINELGVRPVDMAVDKGHYEIAHFLLSVEKQRRESATKQQDPTPRERVAARAVERAPVSTLSQAPAPASSGTSSSRGSGWLVGRSSVAPAGAALTSVSVEATAPAGKAPATAAPPQEKLWSPGGAEQAEAAPALEIVSVAEPRPIAASTSDAKAQGGAAEARANPLVAASEPETSNAASGWLDRVSNVFRGGSSDTSPTAPEFRAASPAPSVAPTPEPAPKPDPVPEPVNASVEEPKPQPVATLQTTASDQVAAAQTEDKSTEGPGNLFNRIAEVFRPTEATQPTHTDTPVEPAPHTLPTAADPGSVPDPVVAQVRDAPEVQKENRASLTEEPEPGFFSRLSNILQPDQQPNATAVNETPVSPPSEVETNTGPASTVTQGAAPDRVDEVAAGPNQPAPVQQRAAVSPAETKDDAITGDETKDAESGTNLFSRLGKIFQPTEPETEPGDDKPGDVSERSVASVTDEGSGPDETFVGDGSARSSPASADTTIEETKEVEGPGLFARLTDILSPQQTEAEAEAEAAPMSSDPPLLVMDASAEEVQTLVNAPTPASELSSPPEEPVADGPGLFARLKDAFTQTEGPAPTAEVAAVEPPIEPAATVAEASSITGTPIAEASTSNPVAAATRDASAAAPASSSVAAAAEEGVFTRLASLFDGGAATSDPAEPAEAAPLKTDGVRKVALPPRDQPPAPPKPAKENAVTGKPAAATPKRMAPAAQTDAQTSKEAAPKAVALPQTAPRVASPVGTASHPKSPLKTGSAAGAVALSDVSLSVANGQGLGGRVPAPGQSQCIDKSRWNTVYCIEPLAWPPALANAFQVSSNFYRGPQSIVEYVAGSAVQIHVLFRTEALRQVSEHFVARFGPPTEEPEIWTSLIGQPRRPNRTLRWINTDPKTGERTTLEIREIDDLRWSSPPDVKNGVVRLSTAGRGSVFELLSSTDLLLVQLRRGR